MKHQMLDRLSQVAMCMVVALVPACTAMMMNRRGAAMPIMLWTALILSVLLSCGFVLVHDRISNITHFMNEFHVSRLLQERSLLAQADDSNQIFDIGLSGNVFVVLLVQHPRGQTQADQMPRRMSGTPKNPVIAALDSALSNAFDPHFTTIDQAEVAIVGLKRISSLGDSEQICLMLELLSSELSQAQTALRTKDIFTRIAVSAAYDRLKNAGMAYQETLGMMEYAIFSNSEQEIISSMESVRPEVRTRLMLETAALERKFFVAATNYQFTEAADYMLEMLEHYSRHHYESVHTIKARFYGRIETVYNLMEIKLDPQMDRSSFRQEFYDEFMGLTTKEQIQEKIRQFFDRLEENCRGIRRTGNHVQDVVEYIQRNYANPELSVSVICEELNINASYLSRMFKQQKGCGVLEYIHQYRIDQVQRLLVATKLELQDIAEQTGYENAKAMGRVFKKYTGITPSAYRGAHGGLLQ